MRVRDEDCFAGLIAQGLDRHLLRGQYRADPARLFERSTLSATVRTLCIVDYRPDQPRGIRELGPEQFADFLEQFAFPVSAYRLKDDLLQHCDGDLDRYCEVYAGMKADLDALVRSCTLLRMNLDMLDPVARREVLVATQRPAFEVAP